VQELERRFGNRFQGLSRVQKLALATAVKGLVTHARLMSMTSVHSRDVTPTLSALVNAGFLELDGRWRDILFLLDKRPECRQDSDEFSSNSRSQVFDRLRLTLIIWNQV
jgi:hypothetical protein